MTYNHQEILRQKRIKKFMNRIKIHESGCWEWVDEVGHALQSHDWYAYHRAWKLFKGGIPKGHELHHTCTNGWCCNPDHLNSMDKKEHKSYHHPQFTFVT